MEVLNFQPQPVGHLTLKFGPYSGEFDQAFKKKVKCLGVCPGGDDRFWNWARHNADLSKEAEEDLLKDDSNPAETTVETNKQDPMFVMMQNVNKYLRAMADSLVAVKQSLKPHLHEQKDQHGTPKFRHRAKFGTARLLISSQKRRFFDKWARYLFCIGTPNTH